VNESGGAAIITVNRSGMLLFVSVDYATLTIARRWCAAVPNSVA
jgi:hypothetical protein